MSTPTENPIDYMGAATALIALTALIVSSYFSYRSIKTAREALSVAERTFRDSALPILQRKPTADSNGPRFYIMALENVGSGKLYNFRTQKVDGNVMVIFYSKPDKNGNPLWYVQVEPQGAHPEDSQECTIVYSYEDRFGQTFTVKHKLTISDLIIDPSYDLDRPEKATTT